ncbi:membrane-spanning 4-domains subfamily A member 7 [Mesocricetus auratus]|uniref:Membrane-spanning 4-domains subfamily A member 7 isoform X1 n=1 Tax=Mesocricetus auratus TaxID=10036 RepID=A0A3Q0CN21_MESAU|nr:membrane-spanning 4-domains subfamily A member 7 [Mesocricetus auratus]XP_021081410.1 membrane-spanning 4-domains subfamily A member 7 [Mesocricetus auratus]
MDIVTHKREKAGHDHQKGDDQLVGVPKETTVLGTIQILCALTIASLEGILVSASYSSYFNPAAFTTLMTVYPFVGSLCFAIAGSLSIISGKISIKPFALSSLASNAASLAVATIGFLLLTHSLIDMRTASLHCNSEKEFLSLLPYSGSHHWMNEDKKCLLAYVSAVSGLVVMLIFTVLELLLAAYSSVVWWKQVYSNKPQSAFFMPESQDHSQVVKSSSLRPWI